MVKGHPVICHRRHRGRVEVQFYSFLTSPLDVGVWSMSCLSHSTPGKQPWYPLYRRFGWPQGQYRQLWRKQNLLTPLGFKPWNAQPVASCHTTYALPAPPLTSPQYPKLIKIKNLNLKKNLPTLQPLLVINFYSCPLIQPKKGDCVSESFISVC